MLEMRPEKQIDECDHRVMLWAFSVVSQEQRHAFLSRALIPVDPANNGSTLLVERHQPPRAVRLRMQVVTFF
ncbi:hypothetical protein D8770_23395 [Methylobacterium sp. DB1607]|nr:hypothetical protein [Methylobacterium sp. DB1607]